MIIFSVGILQFDGIRFAIGCLKSHSTNWFNVGVMYFENIVFFMNLKWRETRIQKGITESADQPVCFAPRENGKYYRLFLKS